MLVINEASILCSFAVLHRCAATLVKVKDFSSTQKEVFFSRHFSMMLFISAWEPSAFCSSAMEWASALSDLMLVADVIVSRRRVGGSEVNGVVALMAALVLGLDQ
eukprot:1953443-Rhodomonas_salina.1